jgi:DNA-binding GntR family transcriptional regulator
MPDSATLQLGVDLSQRRPLRDEAYSVLRQAILSGRFKPGDHLVEREVAAQLGLSRSPVREAFRRLEQDHLVTVTRQGLVVQGLTLRDAEELYQIRQQLEALAARLAARNFAPEQRPRLEEILSRTVEAIAANDSAQISAEGIKFHEALAEIADNRHLKRLLAAITEEIRRFRALYLDIPARSQSALEEHRQILAAVAARDQDQAAALMAEHIHQASAYTQQSQP